MRRSKTVERGASETTQVLSLDDDDLSDERGAYCSSESSSKSSAPSRKFHVARSSLDVVSGEAARSCSCRSSGGSSRRWRWLPSGESSRSSFRMEFPLACSSDTTDANEAKLLSEGKRAVLASVIETQDRK